MEAKERVIEIYEEIDGKRPFEIWINNLKDAISRSRIRSRIDKVATGNLGDFKSIGDGVSELRFNFSPGFRVYFGIRSNTIILLLIGGDKSSQDNDIKKAKLYWNDYMERENGKG